MHDPLADLEAWYTNVCDGDWEHQFGIHIETLDNPGWSVNINIAETPIADKEFSKVKHERGDCNWVHCWVEDETFKGRGGPNNLREILNIFAIWCSPTDENTCKRRSDG
ncbi:MAG: hypothetical protein A2Z34_10585 [Planctomycetes bacterium RBG_16_59_8]|nr:MAG: hypothetical protein A2Z34_10585 [Planctomycetes bacterium RBG_16_59_8]